jgi:transcriptional regulator with XRE-family HTH domain
MTDSSLPQMLVQLRFSMDMNQKQLAEALGCSPQFIGDMERGSRAPSVAFVERVCDYLSRGPKGRREWHVAAARAHGWKI